MREIVMQPLAALKPYSNNARKHSDKQIGKIAGSIHQFGFNNPILVDANKTIIAGHGRWEAAKKLSLEQVPTICLDHLTKDEIRAYIPSSSKEELHILSVPFSTTRANKGAIIMSPKNSDHDPLDLPPHQLRNLVRGIVWRDKHFDGMSIEDIAAREGLSKSGVRKIIMGSFETLMAL